MNARDPERTGTPVGSPEQPVAHIEFETADARDQAVRDIVLAYTEHPYVQSALPARRRDAEPLRAPPDRLLNRYMQEIGQYERPEPDERQEYFGRCFVDIERGLAVFKNRGGLDDPDVDEEQLMIGLTVAYHKLYNANLPLVVSVARDENSYGLVPLIEMIQGGNEGLSEAISRFDVTRGYTFSNYAWWYIRKGVQRAIIDGGRSATVTRNDHNNWVNTLRAKFKLRDELDREPTTAEIADKLGISEEKVELRLRVGETTTISLNSPVSTDSDLELMDLIAGSERADAGLESLSDRDQLRKLLSVLSEDEKLLLSLRHGVYLDELKEKKIVTPDGEERDYEDMIEESMDQNGLAYAAIGRMLGRSATTSMRHEQKLFARVRLASRGDRQ